MTVRMMVGRWMLLRRIEMPMMVGVSLRCRGLPIGATTTHPVGGRGSEYDGIWNVSRRRIDGFGLDGGRMTE